MIQRAYRTSLLVLYQLTVVVGILAMPLALAARRVGLRLPLGRVVEGVGEAYAETEMEMGTRGAR
jgi:hypothetical protein